MTTPLAPLPGSVAMGAPVAFLKIAEVKGEGWSQEHEGEIAVVEWNWGEKNNADPTKPGNCRSKVVMRDFSFTAFTSTASSQMLVNCASGKRLKTAVLTCAEPDGGSILNYLTITFSDVVVTSYDVSMVAGSRDPLDRVTLGFGKIEFTYVGTKKGRSLGGNFTSSWDLAANTK